MRAIKPARRGPRAFGAASERLFLACERSAPRFQEIRELLEDGADPNGQDGRGKSALMRLCEMEAAESEACVNELLSAGANPGLRDSEGESALIKACRSGSKSLARALLASGASPNDRSFDGLSPLAATAGLEEEWAWILLGAGASANDRDPEGRPLLTLLASERESIGWVEALLFHGADPERSDRAGWTPLASAARAGNRGSMRALLEAGSDPQTPGPMGKSPLEIALGARAPEAAMGRSKVAPSHLDCVELMLSLCEGKALRDSLGLPPLIRLWRSLGRFEREWMERLLAAGCALSDADDQGQGLLHWSSEGSEEAGMDLARWALERGAASDSLCALGQRPWERALARDKPRLAELLLSACERAQLSATPPGSGSSARFL